MTKTKSLLVACAAIALSCGFVAGPASANGMSKRYHHGMNGGMMMHHRGMMMHHRGMMMRHHGMMMRHHGMMRHHSMHRNMM